MGIAQKGEAGKDGVGAVDGRHHHQDIERENKVAGFAQVEKHQQLVHRQHEHGDIQATQPQVFSSAAFQHRAGGQKFDGKLEDGVAIGGTHINIEGFALGQIQQPCPAPVIVQRFSVAGGSRGIPRLRAIGWK